jgi:lipoate-protein ligase A
MEPAERQLAGGPALLAGLEQTGTPAMRWYQFSPAALLIGSSQRPQAADLAACATAGLTVHRRRSGGGAVLGDTTLLLLDLALPVADPLYLSDVSESYRWLGEVWAAALRDWGLDARDVQIAEARTGARALSPLHKEVSFGGRSPYEVVVGQRKLIGLAQIRRSSGALFQVGVYLRWSPEHTAALMTATDDERSILTSQLAERVAGLNDLERDRAGEQELTIDIVTRAVELMLARRAGLIPSADDWRASERSAREEAIARFSAIATSHAR